MPKVESETVVRPASSLQNGDDQQEVNREEIMWDTKFLVEDPDAYNDDGRAEIRDKKFKQLLMKNKQLLVMLEKERTGRAKLEREIREYQAVLNSKQEEEVNPKTSPDQQDWKAKSVKFEKKLQEERLKLVQLKNDLDKAVRIIKKEVGEFDSFDRLLSADNSWKGRAQEIEILKSKLKDFNNLNRTAPSDRLFTKKKYREAIIQRTNEQDCRRQAQRNRGSPRIEFPFGKFSLTSPKRRKSWLTSTRQLLLV